ASGFYFPKALFYISLPFNTAFVVNSAFNELTAEQYFSWDNFTARFKTFSGTSPSTFTVISMSVKRFGSVSARSPSSSSSRSSTLSIWCLIMTQRSIPMQPATPCSTISIGDGAFPLLPRCLLTSLLTVCPVTSAVHSKDILPCYLVFTFILIPPFYCLSFLLY